jgi:hypothetical protein
VKLDKLPHDFAEEKVDPTYEAQGYTLCTCKVCGHTEKKDYVEKLEPTPTPVPAPDVNANVINGISVGEDFFVGNTITFTASGANMDITPTDHALRYVPASWRVNPSGTWESAPYTASFTIEKPGTYTLKVTFKEQEYLSGKWNDSGKTEVASVEFNVKEKPVEPTVAPTATPTATPTAEPVETTSPTPSQVPTQAPANPTDTPASAPEQAPVVTAAPAVTEAPVPTATPEIITVPVDTGDKSPATGQDERLWLWRSFVLLASSSLGVVLFFKRRQR